MTNLGRDLRELLEVANNERTGEDSELVLRARDKNKLVQVEDLHIDI